jgi:hypothetical protein
MSCRSQHVHHRDHDPANDDLSNLEVIDPRSHGRLHSTESHNNLRFIAVPDTVRSIESVGEQDTYAVIMESSLDNIIAGGFVTSTVSLGSMSIDGSVRSN